jgi:hypothetical protein
MNFGSLFWIAAFAVAALLFFGVAGVITVVGVRDLKELLRRSDKKKLL